MLATSNNLLSRNHWPIRYAVEQKEGQRCAVHGHDEDIGAPAIVETSLALKGVDKVLEQGIHLEQIHSSTVRMSKTNKYCPLSTVLGKCRFRRFARKGIKFANPMLGNGVCPQLYEVAIIPSPPSIWLVCLAWSACFACMIA